tara:strand:- start:370 stop:741 length:372 start_codon:yes stop_codon:yes gene_type:complete
MSDYTIRFPFELNNQTSGFKSLGEDDLKEIAVFNLKNIILTEPGERIMDIAFGVGIRSFLFEQSNRGFEDLYSKIISQVKRYAPYINIIDLVISPDSENLNIQLKYEVLKTNISDLLELNISL